MPRAWWWLLVIGCWISLDVSAQSPRPQFRKWNVGLVEGLSPLNAYSGLPTVSGHFRNLSVEVSPYVFNMGIAANYHFLVLTAFKKLRFTIDGTAFFARQNASYFLAYPSVIHMENKTFTGLMGGASVYFLKRFCTQFLLGSYYVGHYGPQELQSSADAKNYFLESAAISVQFRLFNNFLP
jgi:hypothetical protein